MKEELLFVYGTLRRGNTGLMAKWLAEKTIYEGKAVVAGRLLDLGRYPGLIIATGSGQHVVGDVYRLPKDGFNWVELDEYEGCGPDDDRPHEYRRVKVSVQLEGKGEVKCWVYLYAWPFETRQILDINDWHSRD